MTLDPQQITRGPLADAYEYWHGLKTDDEVPGIGSFDLLAVPHLVANTTIFEVVGQRIRIRFVGTDIIAQIGEDTTGRYLDEMSNMSAVEARAFNCVETGSPYLLSGLPVTWTSRDFKTYSTLGLPLSGSEATITQIIFVMVFS